MYTITHTEQLMVKQTISSSFHSFTTVWTELRLLLTDVLQNDNVLLQIHSNDGVVHNSFVVIYLFGNYF